MLLLGEFLRRFHFSENTFRKLERWTKSFFLRSLIFFRISEVLQKFYRSSRIILKEGVKGWIYLLPSTRIFSQSSQNSFRMFQRSTKSFFLRSLIFFRIFALKIYRSSLRLYFSLLHFTHTRTFIPFRIS